MSQWNVIVREDKLQTELTPGGHEEYKVTVDVKKKGELFKTVIVRTTATWLVPRLEKKDVDTIEAGNRFCEIAKKMIEVEVRKNPENPKLDDEYDLERKFGDVESIAALYNQLTLELGNRWTVL